MRIPCPKCGEISFTPNVEGFYPCPRCEYFFSGKFGLDRRREPRRLKKIRVKISHRGRNYIGKTFDVSTRGLGVEVAGLPPFSAHEILTIQRRGISSAKIVWVKTSDQKAMIGLEKVN